MKRRNPRLLNILLVCTLLFSLLAACASAPTHTAAPIEQDTPQPTLQPTPQPTMQPTPQPTTPTTGTWLVMLYQDADDGVLEKDIFIDLNEAEIVGSTDQVTIVSQIDRYQGAFSGDGDWVSTKRFLVTQDDDLETINSQEIEDLGEVDSGSKETLIDFATWAIGAYPANHYVLILSDHGAGWNGGWSDDDPLEGSSLRMQDIDDALGTIIANTGIDAFELVGFDACLMGQVEVMSAIAPHARYAVGSEETEPSLGWAYASFLQALNDNPAMTGRELGQVIVSSYIDQDFRITDESARLAYVEEMGESGDYSAASVASMMSVDTTLSAIDLSAMVELNAALNDLAAALPNVDQSLVAEARAYAQAYTSVFGDDVPPSYIDLGHFVDLLLDAVDDPAVTQAAQQVKSALQQTVISEKHGEERPASSGLTIYFPNSELYQTTFADPDFQYGAYVGRFAAASLWDDFLTYHYTGESLDPTTPDLSVLLPAQSAQSDFSQAVAESAPEAGVEVAAPGGGGEISIAPISISAEEIGPDGVVTLSTEITGSNVGYIYYYVSYYSPEDDSYLTADMGFISAENTKEIGGVYYPDWGEQGTISIEMDWEPTLYYMSDGNEENDQFAFFEPETYGLDEKTTTYLVYGTYSFVEDGTQMDAVIRFTGDGEMQSVYGFSGEDGSGAPREITPQMGDTFTITDQWLEFTDANPDGEFVDYIGGTMTFGENWFQMVPYYAYSGDYALGIIVEDLNGNRYEEFVYITVTE